MMPLSKINFDKQTRLKTRVKISTFWEKSTVQITYFKHEPRKDHLMTSV